MALVADELSARVEALEAAQGRAGAQAHTMRVSGGHINHSVAQLRRECGKSQIGQFEPRPARGWKSYMRTRSEPSTQVLQRTEAHVPDAGVTEAPPGRNRLLLLIPEGSLSFRLCSFPDVVAAQSYIRDEGVLMQGGHWVAFWTHDAKPADSDGTTVPAEAVVILRAAFRQDVVQLYSFVDLQAALTYLGASVAHGLDLGSALLYWVTPVSLNVSVSTTPKMAVNPEGQAGATPADSPHQVHSPEESADRAGADRKRPTDRARLRTSPSRLSRRRERGGLPSSFVCPGRCGRGQDGMGSRPGSSERRYSNKRLMRVCAATHRRQGAPRS
jgi:hypothetical protein